MSRSCPVWLHDKLRKHFFHLEDGQFTHCYRVEYETAGCGDYTRWWQVPIPQKRWARRRKLSLVPLGCEIEHQLYLIGCAKFPPAGWFFRTDNARHPRHKQWQELIPLEYKPERWDSKHLIPDSEFVPSPHFTKEHQKDLLG